MVRCVSVPLCCVCICLGCVCVCLSGDLRVFAVSHDYLGDGGGGVALSHGSLGDGGVTHASAVR